MLLFCFCGHPEVGTQASDASPYSGLIAQASSHQVSPTQNSKKLIVY